jgi:hypothetical protein
MNTAIQNQNYGIDYQVLEAMKRIPAIELKNAMLDYFNNLLQKQSQPVVLSEKKQRVFGAAKGEFLMADDFDAPLEDFKEYM